MTILTKDFWVYAGERAVKTFFEVFAALLLVAGVSGGADGAGLEDIDWAHTLSVSAAATVGSVAISLKKAGDEKSEPGKHAA